MNEEEKKIIAELTAKPVADIAVTLIAIVNALRRQPGFDDAKFRAEIKELLARASVSDFQRSVWSSLLGE